MGYFFPFICQKHADTCTLYIISIDSNVELIQQYFLLMIGLFINFQCNLCLGKFLNCRNNIQHQVSWNISRLDIESKPDYPTHEKEIFNNCKCLPKIIHDLQSLLDFSKELFTEYDHLFPLVIFVRIFFYYDFIFQICLNGSEDVNTIQSLRLL